VNQILELIETEGLIGSHSPAALTMEIPAEPRSLSVLRRGLEAALERAGVTQDDIDLILLAVGEACTNAVRHGSPDRGQNRLGISLYFNNQTATIIVWDQGHGFDADSICEPCFEMLSEGGMGIYLMRKAMDQVVFRNTAQGTLVSLTRKLSPPII
jgi:serine/threonine-protein kinase RsbW